MSVLAIQFKKSMSGKMGFVSINELMDDNFVSYNFKNCIKVKNGDVGTFNEVLFYWEESPCVVRCTVKETHSANGFVKVMVLTKKVLFADEIGSYPAKQSTVFGFIINDKFVRESEVKDFVKNTYSKIEITPSSSAAITAEDISGSVTSVLNVSKKKHKNTKKKEIVDDAKMQQWRDMLVKNWGLKDFGSKK